MEINNGFSLFMFLSENLTKEERNNCFKTLIDYEFKGYDFKTGESIEIDELLKNTRIGNNILLYIKIKNLV